jgi:hypothetical protein
MYEGHAFVNYGDYVCGSPCSQACAMVQRLLEPLDETLSEHKRMQLRELATINGVCSKISHD